LDQLINEFFNNKFPGLTEPVLIPTDPLAANLPVLEVSMGIDVSELLEISKDIHIEIVDRPIYPYESEPRIQGWGMQVLWSDGTVVPWIKDLYYKTFPDAIPQKLAHGVGKEIQSKLASAGITAKVCWLSKFSPGGYLRPHRDFGLNPKPLSYFWLPLNAPVGSELKIYPTGTVDITLGNLYLLNQDNYTHAVVNYSNEDRYVLLGHLTDEISPILQSNIHSSIVLNKY
jgi:hypothetical protein